MSQQDEPARLRFGSFELDLRTRELRKDGRLLKLQDQPIKLLALLANRPGELVTREEIEKALWNEDEFVEFEHSINTAVRKIREALGDDPEKPRFVETLPRKGYRFIAPVERLNSHPHLQPVASSPDPPSQPVPSAENNNPLPYAEIVIPPRELESTSAHHHTIIPRATARFFFLLIQIGYL